MRPIDKVLCLLIFILIVNLTVAQTKLTIIYKRGDISNTAQEYIDTNNKVEWIGHYWLEEFTVNDSITFSYCFKQGESGNSFYSRTSNSYSRIPLGSQFFSHANYNDYTKGIVVFGAIVKEKQSWVIDSIKQINNWMYSSETKTILRHYCKSAMLIKDSIIDCIAWYTDELNCDFAVDGKFGLPGMILEIYYPKSGRLYSAIEIKNEAKQIVFPTKYRFLTIDEVNKMYDGKRCCELPK